MGIDSLLERLPVSFPADSGSAWRWRVVWCGNNLFYCLMNRSLHLIPRCAEEMLTLVAEVCREKQLTLLMVSHSVEDAARIAPRSIVVADGRIAPAGRYGRSVKRQR